MNLFISLSENVVKEGIAFHALLDALCCSTSFDGIKTDYSSISHSINYNDFIELLCRLVVSDYWIYEKKEDVVDLTNDIKPSEENKDEASNHDGVNEKKEGSVIEVELEKPVIPLHDLLVERLTTWTATYDFSKI